MENVLNWIIVVKFIYYHSIWKMVKVKNNWLLKDGFCLIKLNLNSDYKKEKKRKTLNVLEIETSTCEKWLKIWRNIFVLGSIKLTSCGVWFPLMWVPSYKNCMVGNSKFLLSQNSLNTLLNSKSWVTLKYIWRPSYFPIKWNRTSKFKFCVEYMCNCVYH